MPLAPIAVFILWIALLSTGLLWAYTQGSPRGACPWSQTGAEKHREAKDGTKREPKNGDDRRGEERRGDERREDERSDEDQMRGIRNRG